MNVNRLLQNHLRRRHSLNTIQVSWYQIVAILDFVDMRMMEEVFLSLSFALRVEPNETELDT